MRHVVVRCPAPSNKLLARLELATEPDDNGSLWRIACTDCKQQAAKNGKRVRVTHSYTLAGVYVRTEVENV